MENRLETPTSGVYKRFAKRLLAYNPSQHDLLVLLFRIATNEGGYTESDLVYMVDKIYSDRDVDADCYEGEVVEEKEFYSCDGLCGRVGVPASECWVVEDKDGFVSSVCKKCCPKYQGQPWKLKGAK